MSKVYTISDQNKPNDERNVVFGAKLQTSHSGNIFTNLKKL